MNAAERLAQLAAQLTPWGVLTRLGGTVTTHQTAIPHGLGGVPLTCLVLSRSDKHVWMSHDSDGTNVYLTATGTTAVDIYVAL